MFWGIFLLMIPTLWQTLGKQQFIWRWIPALWQSQKRHIQQEGKSTEGVTDGEKLSQQNRSAPDPVSMNPQLKFSLDYQALQASIRMVPAMCEPATSSVSPPEEHSGSSHVACSASGSQRSQGWLFRGVELWLAQIQAVCYPLWIGRRWKSELIFREELIAEEINAVLYIAHRLLKVILFKKEVEFTLG